MATLANQAIKDSYDQILHVDNDGGGASTTHVSVKDGDNGTTFGFTIASDALMMTSTNRLELGDTGTYINQSGDGVLNITSDNKIELNGAVVANEGSADVDFRIESNDETHMFFVDGGNNRVSIGDSTDAPAATLEVTNNASSGAFNVPLLQLNNNDTDMRVLDINAANINNQVVDITADSLQDARVINVSADALTTGEILFLDDNSASTSTRNCVTIRQDNDAAVEATALFIQSDAGGTGVKIDKNYPAALVAADTITGLHVDFDHTAPSSGTATMVDIGIDLDVNSGSISGATHTTYGMDIDVVGSTAGTHTAIGIAVDVGSADTNYAALFNGGYVGIGCTDPEALVDISKDSGDAELMLSTFSGTNSVQSSLIFRKAAGTRNSEVIVDGGDSDRLGQIEFTGYDNTGDEYLIGARIMAVTSGTVSDGQMPCQLEFHTNSFSTDASVRMTIDDAGNIGLGTQGIDASASNNIAIANGASPSAYTDNQIYIHARDSSDSLSTLALFTEQAVETSAPTIAHKIKIYINDAEYWIGLDPV